MTGSVRARQGAVRESARVSRRAVSDSLLGASGTKALQ